MDIEELHQRGLQEHTCPFYFSRESLTNADLVLAPYNYVLDRQLRRSINLNFKDSIVIFDEAHNLESCASEAASFTWETRDEITLMRELEVLKAKLAGRSKKDTR